MPPSPVQIKEKLLKGIDEENNIVNPSVVLEVIEALERTALTRNDLEATRLGYFVNKIRKKTSNQDLARRCRRLVKSWQQLANPTPSNQASPGSGCSPASNRNSNASYTASPKLPSLNVSPALQNIKNQSISPKSHHGRLASPAVTNSRVASPAVTNSRVASPAVANSRVASPAVTNSRVLSPAVANSRVSSPGGKLVSPLVRQSNSNGAKASTTRSCDSPVPGIGRSSRISPQPSGTFNVATSQKPYSPSSNSLASRSSTPSYSINPDKQNHIITDARPHTPTNNNHTNSTPNLDSTNRTHAANKKRRRSEESVGSDASSVKKYKNVNNGELRLGERTKTPKVKTTVELIAELQAQKSSSLTASDTITKIVTNQIKKEEDDINISVVPASARPRPRRKNGTIVNPPEAPSDMSRTKSDLVHRFLQQTAQHENNTAHSSEDINVDVEAIDTVDIANDNITKRPVIDLSVDPYSLLPPIDYKSITWSDDDDEDTGHPAQRNPITGEYPDGYEPLCNEGFASSRNIHRVINEDWPGVTGSISESANNFHDWTEMVVINTSDSNKGDVYVLPYVDI